MHILHITEYCHAATIGGTERYILELIRGLDTAGIQNTIGWLQTGRSTETMEFEGVRIVTLPTAPMRVDAPLPEFQHIADQLLASEKPDLLHFHTFGLTEAALAKLAKRRGIPYAFTYHSPAWTCRRGTMLLYGRKPCDGEVRAWRCSACQSQERLGMNTVSGQFATATSFALGWAALPLGRTSLRRRTAFYYDSSRFRRVIRNFLAECDLVVSCCDWSGPVLRRNRARDDSIFHCPQGVPDAVAETLRHEREAVSSTSCREFVVGYVGRVVETKGVHILMEGFSQMDGEEARLRIVGWDTDHTDLPYARRLQQQAQMDPRIILVPKQSFAGTMDEYGKMSLLAVPSAGMETGPLTLLEALALGIPVYGSARIGQLNLLREHGQIVEPNTPASWQMVLTAALKDHRSGKWDARHERIRSIMQLRSMSDVAAETLWHYRKLTTLPVND